MAKLPTKETVERLLNDLVIKFEKQVKENVEARDSKFGSRNYDLEQGIELLKNLLALVEPLHRKVENNEQYSKRVCLGFDNVPLPTHGNKEDCVKKNGDIINDMNGGLDANHIDLVHRIGEEEPTRMKFSNNKS